MRVPSALAPRVRPIREHRRRALSRAWAPLTALASAAVAATLGAGTASADAAGTGTVVAAPVSTAAGAAAVAVPPTWQERIVDSVGAPQPTGLARPLTGAETTAVDVNPGAPTAVTTTTIVARKRRKPAAAKVPAPQPVAAAAAPTTTGAPVAAAAGTGGAADPDVWRRLRQCESGGRYDLNTGNGFYGAYQFSAGTWRALGYAGLPHEAPPAVQDEAARKLQARAGWGQWPACSRRLGLR